MGSFYCSTRLPNFKLQTFLQKLYQDNISILL